MGEKKFGTIVTNEGAALIAECILVGKTLPIIEVAAGDGGGAYYEPTADQTSLKGECWRGEIAGFALSKYSPNMIDVKIIIDDAVGGFTVREMGLFTDEGVLFAICNTPDTEKISITGGIPGRLTMTMHIIVADASVVEVVINPDLDSVTPKQLSDAMGQIDIKLSEHASEISTAKTAAEAAKTAADYVKDKIDNGTGVPASTLGGKTANEFAAAEHTHDAADITGLPSSLTIDAALSSTSENPVQNKAVYAALETKFPKTGGEMSGNLSVKGNITATGNITGAKVYNAVWGADYAEGFDYEGNIPEPGKIVELCGNNKVRTAAAGSEMVIGVSSASYWALAGCSIEEIKRGVKVAVGIAGQLPIKVHGAVKYGDYIVCDGDGIGVAQSKPCAGQVVGRAMESNPSPEIKTVNCIIQVR